MGEFLPLNITTRGIYNYINTNAINCIKLFDNNDVCQSDDNVVNSLESGLLWGQLFLDPSDDHKQKLKNAIKINDDDI